MSAGELTEVVYANSVLAFDGRVLELFGHSAAPIGNRIHVAQITEIKEEADKVVIWVRGMIEYSIVLRGESEGVRAEVASLIAAVRQAAPNI
ncbi:MAG TPA: hypothetical protein VGI17_09670 [Solirubrobacterales bacterium]|jgi:hypothetical protein